MPSTRNSAPKMSPTLAPTTHMADNEDTGTSTMSKKLLRELHIDANPSLGGEGSTSRKRKRAVGDDAGSDRLPTPPSSRNTASPRRSAQSSALKKKAVSGVAAEVAQDVAPAGTEQVKEETVANPTASAPDNLSVSNSSPFNFGADDLSPESITTNDKPAESINTNGEPAEDINTSSPKSMINSKKRTISDYFSNASPEHSSKKRKVWVIPGAASISKDKASTLATPQPTASTGTTPIPSQDPSAAPQPSSASAQESVATQEPVGHEKSVVTQEPVGVQESVIEQEPVGEPVIAQEPAVPTAATAPQVTPPQAIAPQANAPQANAPQAVAPPQTTTAQATTASAAASNQPAASALAPALAPAAITAQQPASATSAAPTSTVIPVPPPYLHEGVRLVKTLSGETAISSWRRYHFASKRDAEIYALTAPSIVHRAPRNNAVAAPSSRSRRNKTSTTSATSNTSTGSTVDNPAVTPQVTSQLYQALAAILPASQNNPSASSSALSSIPEHTATATATATTTSSAKSTRKPSASVKSISKPSASTTLNSTRAPSVAPLDGSTQAQPLFIPDDATVESTAGQMLPPRPRSKSITPRHKGTITAYTMEKNWTRYFFSTQEAAKKFKKDHDYNDDSLINTDDIHRWVVEEAAAELSDDQEYQDPADTYGMQLRKKKPESRKGLSTHTVKSNWGRYKFVSIEHADHFMKALDPEKNYVSSGKLKEAVLNDRITRGIENAQDFLNSISASSSSTRASSAAPTAKAKRELQKLQIDGTTALGAGAVDVSTDGPRGRKRKASAPVPVPVSADPTQVNGGVAVPTTTKNKRIRLLPGIDPKAKTDSAASQKAVTTAIDKKAVNHSASSQKAITDSASSQKAVPDSATGKKAVNATSQKAITDPATAKKATSKKAVPAKKAPAAARRKVDSAADQKAVTTASRKVDSATGQQAVTTRSRAGAAATQMAAPPTNQRPVTADTPMTVTASSIMSGSPPRRKAKAGATTRGRAAVASNRTAAPPADGDYSEYLARARRVLPGKDIIIPVTDAQKRAVAKGLILSHYDRTPSPVFTPNKEMMERQIKLIADKKHSERRQAKLEKRAAAKKAAEDERNRAAAHALFKPVRRVYAHVEGDDWTTATAEDWKNVSAVYNETMVTAHKHAIPASGALTEDFPKSLADLAQFERNPPVFVFPAEIVSAASDEVVNPNKMVVNPAFMNPYWDYFTEIADIDDDAVESEDEDYEYYDEVLYFITDEDDLVEEGDVYDDDDDDSRLDADMVYFLNKAKSDIYEDDVEDGRLGADIVSFLKKGASEISSA